ncbi:MAG TPA: ABC transporter ATP-binding protein [Candidatus Acidoferrales bacterium]|nr:ABC transporter ATP-binding protein [Candidatus Acidoferrales bacterium]
MQARQRVAVLRRLFKEAKPYHLRLAIALVLGVVAGVGPTAYAWAIGGIENRVLAARPPDITFLWEVVVAMIGVAVATNAASYGQNYLTAWCGQRLVASFRVALFARLMRLPLGLFERWRPGELISRSTSDLALMTEAVSISFPQFVQATITFVAATVGMFVTDWLLALVLFACAPFIVYAVGRFNALVASGAMNAQRQIADLSSNLTESLANERVIKAFGREDYEIARFNGNNQNYFGAYMKVTQFMQTQVPVVAIIIMLSVIGMLLFSTREVLAGRMNTGEVFRFWTLVALAINPMNRFAIFFADFQKAIVGASRVYEILDLPVERADFPDAISLGRVRGEIRYEKVTFAYRPEDGAVLEGFDAEIGAGEVVALVGPSGAGKTTIANLVPRFYEPQSGKITLDGIDLQQIRLADLRSAIALVPQETQLFAGTVAENIRYGRLDATDDEIVEAAKIANAAEFIDRLQERYATRVGDRGVRLSGGERARIAIARAVVRNPRILILDEATSALDSHSEVLIEQALDRIFPGRTILIIAHRLSTIRRATKILYIERGSVRETGTHESLLARGGLYAALHAAQH